VNRLDANMPQSRSWRDIPQQVKPRAMSPEGRRRLAWRGVKSVLAIVLVGGLIWAGIEIAATLRGSSRQLTNAAETTPVKEVVLITDGVLDHKWLIRTLALPKNASLMQLDLYELRARVTASGQVRTATLTRNFPATLTVSLSEQSPVARVKAQLGSDDPRTLLVARDGTVFDGVGFDSGMVATLPWLDGVKLARRGAAFAPIAGMETVADLLAKAKLEAEHLYRTWQVVSLARFDADGEIEVRAQGVEKIIFGTHEDFFRQLARLDALLDMAKAQTDQPLREVNLAIGSQVPVSFADPALVPGPANGKPGAARAATPAGRAAASTLPNPQRKPKP
jgi:cell division protein FtsQ